jgi:hypothetical protein
MQEYAVFYQIDIYCIFHYSKKYVDGKQKTNNNRPKGQKRRNKNEQLANGSLMYETNI